MNFTLRKFRSSDVASIVEHINDKIIARNTLNIAYPYTKAEGKKWIEKNTSEQKKKKPSKVNFVIVIDGKAVGSCGLASIDYRHNSACIGYWLGREFWGQGIMSKAVRQLVSYGFKELKLKRIYSYVYPFNKASSRVLEKNGFKHEGTLKKHHYKNGKYYDSLLYAKIRK